MTWRENEYCAIKADLSYLHWVANRSLVKSSLRSKRSHTKRTKFGPREKWGESKMLEPPFLPTFCSRTIFARPECEKAPSRGPNFVRFVQERLLRRLGEKLNSDSFMSTQEFTDRQDGRQRDVKKNCGFWFSEIGSFDTVQKERISSPARLAIVFSYF